MIMTAATPNKRKRTKAVSTAVPVEKPYEIPGLPISEGPSSSQRTLARSKSDQPLVVTMSPAAFQYVWEMLEAKARIDHQKYVAMKSIQSAAEESVAAFRLADREARERPARWLRRRRGA